MTVSARSDISWQNSLCYNYDIVFFVFLSFCVCYVYRLRPLLGTLIGLPGGAYEVITDVGYQLNVTCKCSSGLPWIWLFVDADNIPEIYWLDYDETFNDLLPAYTEVYSHEMDDRESLTIIMNVTYNIVLQCSNRGGNTSVTKHLVVAVNIHPGEKSHAALFVFGSLIRMCIN